MADPVQQSLLPPQESSAQDPATPGTGEPITEDTLEQQMWDAASEISDQELQGEVQRLERPEGRQFHDEEQDGVFNDPQPAFDVNADPMPQAPVPADPAQQPPVPPVVSEPAAPESSFDPYAGLNDQQRAYFEQQQQETQRAKAQYHSMQGRVAAMQRAEAEQRKQLEQLEQFQQQTREKELEQPLTIKEIPAAKQWMEQYEVGPEDVNLVMQMIQQGVNQTLQRRDAAQPNQQIPQEEIRKLVQQEATQAIQGFQQQQLQTEVQSLDDQSSSFHRPGWRNVVRSVEYGQWRDTLPEDEKNFVQQARTKEDMSLVLDLFAQDTGRHFQGWPTQTAQTQTPAQPQPMTYQDLQLAAAQSPPATSARSTVLPDVNGDQIMTDDEFWTYLTQQSDAELRGVR